MELMAALAVGNTRDQHEREYVANIVGSEKEREKRIKSAKKKRNCAKGMKDEKSLEIDIAAEKGGAIKRKYIGRQLAGKDHLLDPREKNSTTIITYNAMPTERKKNAKVSA